MIIRRIIREDIEFTLELGSEAELIMAISFTSLKGSATILVVEDEELCVILLLKCIIFGDIASIIRIINRLHYK